MQSIQLSFNYAGNCYSAFSIEEARERGVPEGVLVESAVEQLRQKIDAAATRARSRNATMIDGQDAMYLLKANEAERYIAAGSPADASAYVLLSAEAAALQITPQEQAARVIAARDAWLLVAARIEAARIGGKASLVGPSTVEAVIDAVEVAVAELDAS